MCGLFSYGIGALLRSTAGAITASVALLFVLFVLSGFLPNSWAVHIDKWIPLNAGGAIWENLSGVHMFSPWVGFGVFCAYAAALVVAGGILFRTRAACGEPGRWSPGRGEAAGGHATGAARHPLPASRG